MWLMCLRLSFVCIFFISIMNKDKKCILFNFKSYLSITMHKLIGSASILYSASDKSAIIIKL